MEQALRELVVEALLSEATLVPIGSVTAGVIGAVLAMFLPAVLQREAFRRTAFVMGVATILLAIGSGCFVYLAKTNPPVILTRWLQDPTENAPWVVGIFSQDAYGPDHKNGLELALDASGSLVHLEILDQASLEDMSLLGSDTRDLMIHLKRLLLTKPVVAVIGPSVDSIDREVLRVVSTVSDQIPVVTESASLRKDMGWGEYDVPVFRISSGVDERGHEFAELIREAVAADLKVTLLVDNIPQKDYSYGKAIYRAILDDLGAHWERWAKQNRVAKIEFDRGRVLELFFEESEGRRREIRENAEVIKRSGLVVLLGVGPDYLPLMEQFYRIDSEGQSRLLGLMNAYTTESKLAGGQYAPWRLLELTDIQVDGLDSILDPETRQHFEGRFGPMSPSLRDQAFSYDAGLVACDALRRIRDLDDGPTFAGDLHAFRRAFTQALRETRRVGLTGQIRFETSGDRQGQNVSLPGEKQLQYAVWGPNSKWRSLSLEEIVTAKE